MITSTDYRGSGIDSGEATMYRFDDMVAIHMPDQETVYMSRDELDSFVRQAEILKNDIDNCKFTQSVIGTLTV